MIAAIECAGAPRDLGLDQGRALRGILREAFERSPLHERWPLPLGAAHARLARDLKRHFPHLAESLAGLAAGAGVPERWLVRRLADELATPCNARAVACAAAAGALLASRLRRALGRAAQPPGGGLRLPRARAPLAGGGASRA